MMHSLIKLLSFGSLIICTSLSTQASELKSYIRSAYPSNISNVYQLMKYVLEGTDYVIYIGNNAPDDARQILKRKIEEQSPQLVLSRTDAILLAIGKQNSIVIDHKNKLISVTRNPIHD